MGILKLGYLEIRVKDIAKAAHYYTQVLGLKETARLAGKIYLKAWDEWEHHQLILVEDPTPGLNRMAFRLESLDDLAYFENRLEQHDYRVERSSRHQSAALSGRLGGHPSAPDGSHALDDAGYAGVAALLARCHGV